MKSVILLERTCRYRGEMMRFFQNIVAWIVSLESGKPFQKWVPIILKILGVVAYAFAFVWSIALIMGVVIARGDSDGLGKLIFPYIGSILIGLFNIGIGTLLIMLFWNRSNKITDTNHDSSSILLKIAVILIRLSGEIALIILISIGLHTLVLAIFGIGLPGGINLFYLPSAVNISISVDWMFGVISLIFTSIYGIIALIFSYALAALLNLIIGMATDLRKIDTTLSTEEISSDS